MSSVMADSIIKEIKSYISLLESTIKKVEEHELQIGDRLKTSEEYFNRHIDELKLSIFELKSMLTQAGAERFKAMSERALCESQDNLLEVKKVTENFHNSLKGEMEYLHRIAESSSNWIAESVKSLKLDDFRKLMFESIEQIEEISKKAFKRINGIGRLFNFQNFGLVFIVSILVSFLTSWFVTNEAPWESHKKISDERKMGKIWYGIWPQLTIEEKNGVQKLMTKYL